MRLTEKDRWTYPREDFSREAALATIRQDEWMVRLRELLPERELDILELGCAPGRLSAGLMLDKPWTPFGIDYSDDSDLYVSTLAAIGKQATLYRQDLFDTRIDRQFDAVVSFGLIEHFRGTSLDDLLALHDSYVEPGGYLAIVVPNFTGFQYAWHYIFDRPDLGIHNVDVMQPATFEVFDRLGYENIFKDYYGTMRLWGTTGVEKYIPVRKAFAGLAHGLSAAARTAAKVGLRLNGPAFSPYFMYVGRKPDAALKPS